MLRDTCAHVGKYQRHLPRAGDLGVDHADEEEDLSGGTGQTPVSENTRNKVAELHAFLHSRCRLLKEAASI